MTALAAAIETLFADPNLAQEAVYREQGTGDPLAIRIIARRPDQVIDFGDTRLHAETSLFDVRVSDIESPRPGDTLEVDGGTFVVQGKPVRDPERLIWALDVRPR
jgi:hypothetical protein